MAIESHSLVAMVQGSIGAAPVVIGVPGACRFCGSADPRRFRNTSHTMPEALGNKWITSVDECDVCNRLFAAYDDALAKSVGPILTVGGTQGKQNRVRQTGRTGAAAVIRHGEADGRRRISVEVHDRPLGEGLEMNPLTGDMRITTPVAPERLIPRYAFKALAKTALAVMPVDELGKFTRLREWIQVKDDVVEIEKLHVGMSFGSVGNAPPLVAAALLKRNAPAGPQPYMISVLCVGSVCFQIALMEDLAEGEWPAADHARCGIRWTNVLAGDGEELVIDYGLPTLVNWASPELDLPPLESIVTAFNIHTSEGSISPVFRRG